MNKMLIRAQQATMFCLSTAIFCMAALGALGVNPFVSSNTVEFCNDPKVGKYTCRTR